MANDIYSVEDAEDLTLGWVDRIVLFVAKWIGGLVLTFMVGVTVVDVTMRYVFNSPIPGGEDYGSLSLCVLVAAAIAYSARTGAQVSVELFVNLAGPRITRWTDLTAKLLTIAMLAVLGWQLIAAGMNAAEYGEASLALLIPMEPFFYAMAVGMALYALVLLAEIVIRFRRGEPLHETDL
jgi:TRAP-type C4-dicarboxylate transport system permease small subunit